MFQNDKNDFRGSGGAFQSNFEACDSFCQECGLRYQKGTMHSCLGQMGKVMNELQLRVSRLEHEKMSNEHKISSLEKGHDLYDTQQRDLKQHVYKIVDDTRGMTSKTADLDLQMNKNQILISDLTSSMQELFHQISELKLKSELMSASVPLNLEQRNMALSQFQQNLPREEEIFLREKLQHDRRVLQMQQQNFALNNHRLNDQPSNIRASSLLDKMPKLPDYDIIKMFNQAQSEQILNRAAPSENYFTRIMREDNQVSPPPQQQVQQQQQMVAPKIPPRDQKFQKFEPEVLTKNNFEGQWVIPKRVISNQDNNYHEAPPALLEEVKSNEYKCIENKKKDLSLANLKTFDAMQKNNNSFPSLLNDSMLNTTASSLPLQKPLMNKSSMSKQMRLKEFLQRELEKRGIDRFSKNLKGMCSEIQACMIEFQEQQSPAIMSQYVYVYYDFGGRIPEEKMKEIKLYLKENLIGKECIGSINIYCGRVNGFFVMDRQLYEMFRSDATSIFEEVTFEEKEDSNATFCIHDKWGRAESFLLFD